MKRLEKNEIDESRSLAKGKNDGLENGSLEMIYFDMARPLAGGHSKGEPSVPPLCEREDRVGKFLKKYMKSFVFDEFSDSFLDAEGLEFMKGVPIPLRKEDMKEFMGGKGIKSDHLAENMAWVMGVDPSFRYIPNYARFYKKYYSFKVVEGLLKEGRNEAEREEYDQAAIHLRAALVLRPDYLDAMYSYARVCREQYLSGGSEDFVGRYKAEAMENFELLTIAHPQFANGHYYLGYAYLNMGLYRKAALTWEDFLKRSHNRKDKKEIQERLQQLAQPIEIEDACNLVLAGKWQEGIPVLERFRETRFKDWWPLSYYLGVAYDRTDRKQEAADCFKEVLLLNPSHIETMKELSDVYTALGDKANAEKYSKKAALIASQMGLDENADIKADI